LRLSRIIDDEKGTKLRFGGLVSIHGIGEFHLLVTNEPFYADSAFIIQIGGEYSILVPSFTLSSHYG